MSELSIELSNLTSAESANFSVGTSAANELHVFTSYGGYSAFPQGLFYISSVKVTPRNNGNFDLKVEALDSFVKFQEKLSTSYSTNTTVRDAALGIAAQCGTSFYSSTALVQNQLTNNLTTDLTCYEALNYLMQYNAAYNADGDGSLCYLTNTSSSNGINVNARILIACYLRSTYEIQWEEQYQKQLTLLNETVLYGGVIIANDSDTFTYPNTFTGKAAKFFNPLFTTAASVSNFCQKVILTTPRIMYTPLDVKYKPDLPINFSSSIGCFARCYQKEDSVDTLFIDYTLSIAGGDWAEIKKVDNSETEEKITISPTDRKIERTKSVLEEAMGQAIAKINGTNGGYIKLLDLDNDGSPDNLFITDVDITEDDIVPYGSQYVLDTGTGATNVIRINKSGVGISSGNNAGTALNGYSVALTGDGINANVINAGYLSADRIRTGIITSVTGNSTYDLNSGVIISEDNTTRIKIDNGQFSLWKKGSNDDFVKIGGFGRIGTGIPYLYFDTANANEMVLGGGTGSTVTRYITLNNNDGIIFQESSKFDYNVTIDGDLYAKTIYGSKYYPSDGSSSNALEFHPYYSNTYIEVTDNGLGYGSTNLYLMFHKTGSYYRPLYTDNTCNLLYWGHNQVTTSSSEKFKTNINKADINGLQLINNSTIYDYKYKDEKEEFPTKYGLIIERECPEEVIDNSGDAINLYSMTSISWKAIQELTEKIEKLEARINELEGGDNNG